MILTQTDKGTLADAVNDICVSEKNGYPFGQVTISASSVTHQSVTIYAHPVRLRGANYELLMTVSPPGLERMWSARLMAGDQELSRRFGVLPLTAAIHAAEAARA